MNHKQKMSYGCMLISSYISFLLQDSRKEQREGTPGLYVLPYKCIDDWRYNILSCDTLDKYIK